MTGAVLPLVLLVVPAVGPPKDEVVGSGNSVTEKRQLQEFDEIEFRIAGDFTGWEQDNAKFEDEFERLVKALRSDQHAREYPPASKL